MIDTKRLATSAAYWDECGAPEWATHYDTHVESFMVTGLPGSDNIPRPQAPEAEWVEYPSGTGKLIVSEPDNNGVVIVLDEAGEYRRVAKDNIKPARTKAQRDRDELVKVLMEYPITDDAVDEIADAIIAAGWTKP